MTNREKHALAGGVKEVKRFYKDSHFSVVEAWNLIKEHTGIGFKVSTVRTYLKAFGAKKEFGRAYSKAWRFQDVAEKEKGDER